MSQRSLKALEKSQDDRERMSNYHATTALATFYNSEDCLMTINGQQQAVDRINPATKYSVPTVANGYEYVGTQGALQDPTSCNDDPTNACFNSGTLYMFGTFSNRQCN